MGKDGILRSLKRAFTNSGFFTVDQSKRFDADDELMLAALHPDAHEEGGLACNDKQLLAEMRECIMQWIKSMGRQILQGNLNLVNTSFPVLMFEPRSYLQKLVDICAYPSYINAAAASVDPLERMKLVVTWLVAGLHHSVDKWKKPFNPILGETWQAAMPGGLQLYMEQISHHPPVSAYQVEGPGWRLEGWSQPAVVPVVKFYGIKTMAKGERHIIFDSDGSTVKMTMPHFAIKGVVYAEKPHAEVLGVARLLDEKNHLEAVINFGSVPKTRQRMLARADAVCGEIYQLPRSAHLQDAVLARGAIQRSATAATALTDLTTDAELLAASLDHASTSEQSDPADADDEAILEDFNAKHFGSRGGTNSIKQPVAAAAAAANGSSGQHQAYHRSKSSILAGDPASYSNHRPTGGAVVPGVAVARIEGCWLSHLNIDNKRYWTLSEANRQHFKPASNPLPSDLQYRQDLAAVAAGDMAAAQRYKEEGEQQQRADRRLRESAGVFEH